MQSINVYYKIKSYKQLANILEEYGGKIKRLVTKNRLFLAQIEIENEEIKILFNMN